MTTRYRAATLLAALILAPLAPAAAQIYPPAPQGPTADDGQDGRATPALAIPGLRNRFGHVISIPPGQEGRYLDPDSVEAAKEVNGAHDENVPAHAGFVRVPWGASGPIDSWGFCRWVENRTPEKHEEVIDVQKSPTWENFRQARIPGFTETVCCRPRPVTLCGRGGAAQTQTLPYAPLARVVTLTATCVTGKSTWQDQIAMQCGQTGAGVMADGLWTQTAETGTPPADCPASGVSWGVGCNGFTPALSNGDSVPVTNTRTGFTGTATAVCRDSFLHTGGTCTQTACDFPTVDHGTVSPFPNCRITCDSGYVPFGADCVPRKAGASCPGGIAGWGPGLNCTANYGPMADTARTELTNTNVHYTGTATVMCDGGTVVKIRETCVPAAAPAPAAPAPAPAASSPPAAPAPAGCPAGTASWGAGCSASTPALTNGASAPLTSTAPGFAGRATATCANGTVITTGTTCTPTASSPAASTPPAGCTPNWVTTRASACSGNCGGGAGAQDLDQTDTNNCRTPNTRTLRVQPCFNTRPIPTCDPGAVPGSCRSLPCHPVTGNDPATVPPKQITNPDGTTVSCVPNGCACTTTCTWSSAIFYNLSQDQCTCEPQAIPTGNCTDRNWGWDRDSNTGGVSPDHDPAPKFPAGVNWPGYLTSCVPF